MSKVDYLTEDTLGPHDQKFVCLSFLVPGQGDEHKSLYGVKVRGVFNEYEEACAHAKKLQEADGYHHIFIGECHKWLAITDGTDEKLAKDNVYANEKLNDMMHGYMKSQEQAKVYHEQRKTEMVRQNLLDNMTNQEATMKDLQTQLESASGDEKATLENNIKAVEAQIKKMELKKKDVEVQLDQISKQMRG